MPIYEYRCDPCDHEFEALIRTRDDAPLPALRRPRGGQAVQRPGRRADRGGAGASLPVCAPAPAGFGCGGGPCMSGMCGTD